MIGKRAFPEASKQGGASLKLFPSLRAQISTHKVNYVYLGRSPLQKSTWTSIYHSDPNWYFWLGKQNAWTLANLRLLLRSTPTPQTQEIREGVKEPQGGAGRPTVHALLRLQWVRLRSGSPLSPPAPHPTLGAYGGSHRFQLPPGCGGGLGMAILLPLHSPIPHQQQKECVRPRGGRASSGGRPHSPLSVPGSRLRGCRTRAHTARGSCAARSRRRPGGKRSPRRGPSAHSTRWAAWPGPDPARLGPASARGGGGGGAWLVLQADGAGCSLARPFAPSLPHTRSVTHSLPPSPASTAATTRLQLRLPACRPACLPPLPPSAPAARRPAPPQRRCRKARLTRSAFAAQRRGGAGKGRREVGEDCRALGTGEGGRARKGEQTRRKK